MRNAFAVNLVVAVMGKLVFGDGRYSLSLPYFFCTLTAKGMYMARTQLFEFKHDNETIKVYTGESSADVYYSVNNGTSHSAGFRWNESRGDFKSGSGSIMSNEQAKAKIRNFLSD